jgi:hypothetical protein
MATIPPDVFLTLSAHPTVQVLFGPVKVELTALGCVEGRSGSERQNISMPQRLVSGGIALLGVDL